MAALKNVAIRKSFKSLIPGAIAGLLAGSATMPIDTVSDTQKQWRMTKGEPELNHISKSFWRTARELYKPKIRKDAEGGISPFYAGYGGKMSKIVPNSALSFLVAGILERKLRLK